MEMKMKNETWKIEMEIGNGRETGKWSSNIMPIDTYTP